MAFLRFTRDKRGYEQFSLVEQATNRRGKSRSRLLYWYRTPPNVRVGREPFDESVRRALEAQYPSVQFDWRKIVETPIPSAETERWRERRRAEKAEKAARRAVAVEDEPQVGPEDESDVEVDASAEIVVDDNFEASLDPEAPTMDADAAQPAVAERPTPNSTGRRRRRRRGGRGRQDIAPQTVGNVAPLAAESDAAPESESKSDVESPFPSDLEPDSKSDVRPGRARDSQSDSQREGE